MVSTPTTRRLTLGLLVALSLNSAPGRTITVTRNEAVPDFPREIRFELSASSQATIESVELEFGTDARACGQSLTRAFPKDFTPAASVDAEWTWDMRRTGALPPGTTVWWRWKIRDASGAEATTPEGTLLFTDVDIQWRSLQSGSLILFWHQGSDAFAQSLLEAGEHALADLRQATGVEPDGRTKVFVYSGSEEMQAATLFAPDWSGGLAFPEHRTVLLGIPTTSLTWGMRALAHELSHVVIGYYTFSCVDRTPTWLSEGLAMGAEGDLEPYYAAILENAVQEDTLLSVRSLGGIFSGDPGLAWLAYAQSHSLVRFLTENYGNEKMLALLDEFRMGMPEDLALQRVFGFDRDGLEVDWRAWVGAPPMRTTPGVGIAPTHTPYPTIAPIMGPVSSATETPRPQDQPLPVPSVTTASEATTEPNPLLPIGTTFGLITAGACALVILLLLVVAGWILLKRHKAA